ncbi:unnamed protein product [Mytilus edulis]|uniref:PLG n=1 Tax=Mytilus edulis TaxID=6550 RepID=A0A8S3T7X7_MYTED|nr:unnamed protein product [Mytilus edulis]
MSHCHQIQEEKFTIWQGYQFNNTVILDLPLLGKNMIDCAFKCLRSQHCKAVSYNDLSKTCDFHGTEHSTLVITNVTDENQYLVIPKDMPTTTNLIEAVNFEETTVNQFLPTVQDTAADETVAATSTPQQKNWITLEVLYTEKLSQDCYLTTSLEYHGTLSYTISRIQCQYWNANYSPHTIQFLPVDTTAHDTNYCRESTNNEGVPGCYTSDPAVLWEPCFIVKCNTDWNKVSLPPGKLIGMAFTCDTLTPGTSVDHCPVSQCGSDDQWTTGYSVSCTAEDCYTDSTKYKGKVTCTVSGITCLNWVHAIDLPSFPDDDTNYCRDPDSTGAPWCYTTDPNVRWEYCPVPKCE